MDPQQPDATECGAKSGSHPNGDTAAVTNASSSDLLKIPLELRYWTFSHLVYKVRKPLCALEPELEYEVSRIPVALTNTSQQLKTEVQAHFAAPKKSNLYVLRIIPIIIILSHSVNLLSPSWRFSASTSAVAT